MLEAEVDSLTFVECERNIKSVWWSNAHELQEGQSRCGRFQESSTKTEEEEFKEQDK